jgi:hypothetical protein
MQHEVVAPSSWYFSLHFGISAFPLCISRKSMIPVTEHAMVLNSVPKGSGFRKIKEIFGDQPVLSFRGRHADIDSSKILTTDAATFFCRLKWKSQSVATP